MTKIDSSSEYKSKYSKHIEYYSVIAHPFPIITEQSAFDLDLRM